METPLANKQCIPCRGGMPALLQSEKIEFKKRIAADWSFSSDQKRLERTIQLKAFAAPMALAQKIAVLADEEDHHPELIVNFGKLQINIWTHKINDLVESDFILAAKIDELLKEIY
jgi:4a-hydroxytetrahydrobiopterin dehydratase